LDDDMNLMTENFHVQSANKRNGYAHLGCK